MLLMMSVQDLLIIIKINYQKLRRKRELTPTLELAS